jgi:tRNA(fMet)-specific endonuclease VapC
MRFLLDTNVVSATMRRDPSRRLLQKLAQHDGQFGISAVTWQELAYGVRRLPEGARKRALEARLGGLRAVLQPILPYTLEAADWLATEMARLEAKGRHVTCEDGQIAATAWVSGATIVTANTKHFSRFRGVHVVDWIK